ncbi:MAG TPA: response regulator [Thermoanaerobaculia bacterium]
MPPRVLVADDDRQLQLLLNVLLTRAGFEVDFANDGREALDKSIADSYDAIMLDLILPNFTGMQVLERLKKEKPEALRKVIIITGASRAVVEQVDTSGVHALLLKPFDIQDVIRVTSSCIYED